MRLRFVLGVLLAPALVGCDSGSGDGTHVGKGGDGTHAGKGGDGTQGGKDGNGGRAAAGTSGGDGGRAAAGPSGGAGAAQAGTMSAKAGGPARGGAGSGGTNASGGTGASDGGMAGSGQSGSAGEGESMGEPGVRFVGRTETGTKGPRFSWPGTSIAARFSGTQATLRLDDAANENEFEVIVDETESTLVTQSGKTDYVLATGLDDREHQLLVWRRTEAYYNPTEFLGLTGFSAGGALLSPPAPKAHRIEAIGDSITVGYGNEGSPGCTADTTNENNYLAYASVAARALDAELVTIAWSGIGMYRNYGETNASPDAMPARYDRAVPTENDSTWDFSKFEPDLVTINLGTNDYSTHGDPGTPFVTAYVNFLGHVRTKYPNAYIICLIQQGGSDTNIDMAVDMFESGGEDRIESFDINVSTGGSGCDGHPDVAKDQAMGEKLTAEVKRVLSW